MSTSVEPIIHSETWVGVSGEFTFPSIPNKETFHVTSKQPYTSAT